MRVIGVGYGRTGTTSLKVALETLGAGPCYHMTDVIKEPSRARGWLSAAAGSPPRWDDMFAGYSSTVDWPGSAFWRELVDAYPKAKAILTVRDPHRWYDSMDDTILRAWRQRREQPAGPPPPGRPDMSDFNAMTEAVVSQRVFGGRAEERDHAIAAYHRHVAEVKATVPADRLLVFEVAQGWEPLCAFLDVPLPDEPFPRANDSAAFKQRQAGPTEAVPGNDNR